VDAALLVAELTTLCLDAPPSASRAALVGEALATLPGDSTLREAVAASVDLAVDPQATHAVPNTGYAVHTLQAAAYYFIRHGDRPLTALQQCILNGGDTDSIAAILGGWCGALCGEQALPAALLARINDGPFGPSHLRALGRALDGEAPEPRFAWPVAMLRNLALYPVVLAHGLRRLIPW
jgi:ADP-ribosylglycohydrolase